MFSPSAGFLIGLIALVVMMNWLRLSLSIALVVFSILLALLVDGSLPFRHLVDGSFGYLNLILALFAGAFFGQAMQVTNAANAFGQAVLRWCGQRQFLVVLVAAILLFVSGAMVGIAGVAVLATGVFVVPMLKGLGMSNERTAAFIAVLSTCGMIAPPVNVPAMAIADGVNMPYADFEYPLLILGIVPAIVAVWLFSRKAALDAPAVGSATQNSATQNSATQNSTTQNNATEGGSVPGGAAPEPAPTNALAIALIGLLLTLGFWLLQRAVPAQVPDPAVPLVLVVGSVAAWFKLNARRFKSLMLVSFSGTPLVLAGVLATVGIAVQIMTYTGVRGWLVISALSFPDALLYLELLVLPIFGSVLTSMGTADVLGVPLAFSFIHQDMIINVASLSAISAVSEFMPPTAIATALSLYVVGGQTRLLRTLRYCLVPVVVLFVTAVLMLVFAQALAPIISVG